MSSRLLWAGLGLAFVACLVGPARATAKPPDLPLIVEDEYAPQPSQYIVPDSLIEPGRGGAILLYPPGQLPEMESPVQVEDGPLPGPIVPCGMKGVCEAAAGTEAKTTACSGLPKLSVKARRNLAACLLFTIHPLLGVTPTDELVDLPEDHPFSGKIHEGLLVQLKKCKTGDLVFGVGVNSNSGLTGSIVLHCPFTRFLSNKNWVKYLQKVTQSKSTCPMTEWVKFVERLLTQTKKEARNSSPCGIWSSGSEEIVFEEEGPTPKTEEYCPWMKQQARQCPPSPVVDPQVTGDVLTNLQNLIDAEDLLKVAEKLRERGQVCEALDCYEIISKLCPGSRYEEMANQARTQMFSGIYTGTCETEAPCVKPEETSSAYVPACQPPTASSASTEPSKKTEDWKSGLKKLLQTSVTLNYSVAPLSQVVDEIRALYGVNLVLDSQAIKAAGIDPDTNVTIKVDEISLRSALKLTLHQAQLKYVYKDEVLLIVPEKKAAIKSTLGVWSTPGVMFPCGFWNHLADGKKPISKVEPGVCEQVRGLMKACRLAVETGRHQKAIQLAREAFALDAERVSADPLVYKMHLVSISTHPYVCVARCVGAGVGYVVGGKCCGTLIGGAIGATAGAYVVGGKKCCCGEGTSCGHQCSECKCSQAGGCPVTRFLGRSKWLRVTVHTVFSFYKLVLSSYHVKAEGGCCTEKKCGKGCGGCSEKKCGKGCPVGCSKQCGKGDCECSKKGSCCCETKKKCTGCCGSPCTPGSDKPCSKGCGSCPSKVVYPGCYPPSEEECETPCEKTKDQKTKDQKTKEKCGTCPVNNCTGSPCSPPKKGCEPEPEACGKPSLRPCLPAVDAGLVRYLEQLEGVTEEQEPKDLEVVVEDQSAKSPVEMKLGFDLSRASMFLFNTTCADVKVKPGQTELSWQVKLGPCVWQIRCSKAGCWIDPLPTESDE